MLYIISLLLGLQGATPPVTRSAAPPPPVKVVTSLTTYAAIAREIVGDRGQVNSIATGDENPHYVQPKPSFVPLLAEADVFVTTGLDLELWVPALLDKAGNSKVTEGGPGYVAAYSGIQLLDVPASFSRSQGDIHVFGNPHIWEEPLNGVQIARNILTGLKRVSPENADYFTAREKDFEDRIYKALYGEELVTLLGGQTLADLDRQGKLFEFLNQRRYKGAPLAERLGGWLKQALIFRGQEMACYHKEWDYFSREFGISCVDYIEPKPGIPPTPKHVRELIDLMQQRHVRVLLSPGYFDHNQIRQVAERTGAKAVIVPSNVGGASGVNTFFDLINTLVTSLSQAFAASASSGR
ncbi:MAG TPA: metal ABC transporter substrate-binding protein [Gemmatimonadales bacterium]|jgi:ABC-type Zn uptake system ZnuABC Zn-binding protein ZnuA|nr:metal ABC transporter substrate-binding protein [Gemmatimonadales bacterium]